METLFKTCIIASLSGLLVACNSNSSSRPSTPAPDPLPQITSLTKSTEMTLHATVKAESACVHCDPEQTLYTWTVDRTGTGVFGDTLIVDNKEVRDHIVEGPEFRVTEDDFGKAVRLTAVARADDQKSEEAFVVYRRRFVESIVSNHVGFTALTNDGIAVAWGQSEHLGGDPVKAQAIREIIPNHKAFAGIRSDGSVVAWGDRAAGADTAQPSGGDLSSGVVNVFAAQSAFAALKDDGSVVAWDQQ